MFARPTTPLCSPTSGHTSGASGDTNELTALKAAMVDSMPQLAWIGQVDGAVLWCNKRFLNYTGLKQDQLQGVAWHQVLEPQTRPQMLKRWQNAIAAQEPFELEWSMRAANGTYRQFLVGAVPWRDDSGKVINWLGTCTDIQSQKEAQEMLRTQQTELRVLFNLMPAYVWFKDTKNNIIRVNQSAADATGLPIEQIEGKSARDIYPENADQFYADDLAIIKNGTPKLAYMEAMTTPTGDERWVQTDKVPYFNNEGEVIGLVVVARDITEQKRINDRIKSQEARFRSIFEGSRDAIILVSDQGIFDCNARAIEMFGYDSKEEFLSRNPATLSPQKQPDGSDSLTKGNAYMAQALSQGSIRFEWTHTRKNGEEFQCEVHISAFEYEGKRVMQGTTHDITDRKNAQEALTEASRLAGMAEVAINVLHNVGNVLNSVNVSATLINECVSDSGSARLEKVVAVLESHKHDMAAFVTQNPQGKQLTSYLAQLAEHQLSRQKTCVNEIKSLQKNIDHIKTIVALQQSHAKISGPIEPIQLADLANDSLHIVAGVLRRSAIKVHREFETVGPALAEKHKVLQILVNLLRNAEQACVESGRTDKEVSVKITSTDKFIRVIVKDNGIGIQADNLNRIFNQGFTTKKDGHGFGLHSAAIAAKEMNGSLTVKSAGPGQGAQFTLDLPAAKEA